VVAQNPKQTSSIYQIHQNSAKSIVQISTMTAIQSSCDQIIYCVRGSLLNFSIHETPYSLYLTIRKSLSNSTTEQNISSCQKLSHPSENDIAGIRKKLERSESANNSLQLNYQEAVGECESYLKKVDNLQEKVKECEQKAKLKDADLKKKDDLMKILQTEKANAIKEISDVEIKLKDLGKYIKAKDKELHDMKNENVRISENLANVKSEYSDLSAKVRNEEKARRKSEKKSNTLTNQVEIFGCNLCDAKIESMVKLRSHERIH
jgi:chromosome segregation ATPase